MFDDEELERRRVGVFAPITPEGAVRHFVPDHCANCLSPLTHWLSRLFCDTWCRETAALARYARGAIASGRYDADPTIPPTIDLKIAFLLIGGYESFGRVVSTATRDEVLARDGGECVQCGNPANQVDHIAGNSNSSDNLQLLCDSCHRTKTDANLSPAPAAQSLLVGLFKVKRIKSPEPVLLCDDHEFWSGNHRRLTAERKARIEHFATTELAIDRKYAESQTELAASILEILAERDNY